MNNIEYIGLTVAAWNMITFIIYGLDKRRAVRKKWRISENTLLLCAALMGGLGALLGMGVFHHKTKHLKFRIGVPLAFGLNVAVLIWLICYKGW